jgi:hypothetical protein
MSCAINGICYNMNHVMRYNIYIPLGTEYPLFWDKHSTSTITYKLFHYIKSTHVIHITFLDIIHRPVLDKNRNDG